jgi:D-ribose pyranase
MQLGMKTTIKFNGVMTMKKTGILNREISALISAMGHQDQLCVADAGLAIPNTVKVIDLALEDNVPTVPQVLRALLKDYLVEKVIMADIFKTENPKAFAEIQEIFKEIPMEFIPHATLKQMVGNTKGVIRTGDFTPNSNFILVGGADPKRWVSR